MLANSSARLAAAAAALMVLLVSGCNTVQGAGQDLSAAGSAVSETATETQTY